MVSVRLRIYSQSLKYPTRSLPSSLIKHCERHHEKGKGIVGRPSDFRLFISSQFPTLASELCYDRHASNPAAKSSAAVAVGNPIPVDRGTRRLLSLGDRGRVDRYPRQLCRLRPRVYRRAQIHREAPRVASGISGISCARIKQDPAVSFGAVL